MKGILLAWICLMGAFGISLIGLRLYSGKKYYKVFRNVFPLAILAYVWIYGSTSSISPDSGFFSVDFLNGLLWVCLIFHLFWDGMYMFFVTGFSTGILGALFKNRKAGMTECEILESYVGNATRVLLFKTDY